MISYAQNFEDVILNRVFRNQEKGFYIDVGAWDPTIDSVTKWLYDNAWSGINIEPVKEFYDKLVKERPRDINLNIALGNESGIATLNEWVGTALSTIFEERFDLAAAASAGFQRRVVTVPLSTLSEVTSKFVSGVVDFLKIDVEGAERQVLEGGDWSRCRPRILIIEAVEPMSAPGEPRPSWHEWEHIVLNAGYGFALYDGINRYYFRREEPELLKLLERPASVLDDFTSYKTIVAQEASRKSTILINRLQNEIGERDVTIKPILELLAKRNRKINSLRSRQLFGLRSVYMHLRKKDERLPETSMGVLPEFIKVPIPFVSKATQHEYGLYFLGDLSDGELILAVGELLFPSQMVKPRDVEFYRGILQEIPAQRLDFIRQAIETRVAHDNAERATKSANDPGSLVIMGTDQKLTRAIWEKRAAKFPLKTQKKRQIQLAAAPKFQHSGRYIVSAIASLYKGRRYIENFLENITSQSIFNQSELIIIDADSPEGEEPIIATYKAKYPNIVYKRINYRIGVYDAWNVGIQIARGKYLTTASVDDLRRGDSFELQAAILNRHSFVDIVYQDFFYNFDSSLSFDDVAKFGFKSELPILTPQNILEFNSPHNAPMWRKSLHDEVGLFDTSFRSAGDYEFWLRCMTEKKCFFKINTPHVAYLQNPEGLSTRPDTHGLQEAHTIMSRYCRKLISKQMLLSRQAFAETLGIAADWQWRTSYYDVVQEQLKALIDRHQRNESKAQ